MDRAKESDGGSEDLAAQEYRGRQVDEQQRAHCPGDHEHRDPGDQRDEDQPQIVAHVTFSHTARVERRYKEQGRIHDHAADRRAVDASHTRADQDTDWQHQTGQPQDLGACLRNPAAVVTGFFYGGSIRIGGGIDSMASGMTAKRHLSDSTTCTNSGATAASPQATRKPYNASMRSIRS